MVYAQPACPMGLLAGRMASQSCPFLRKTPAGMLRKLAQRPISVPVVGGCPFSTLTAAGSPSVLHAQAMRCPVASAMLKDDPAMADSLINWAVKGKSTKAGAAKGCTFGKSLFYFCSIFAALLI